MIRTGARTAAVVDASVALKWLVPEPESEAAVELRRAADAGGLRLYAPQHWLAEVANVLWVRTRRTGAGSLTAGEARDRARSLTGAGVHVLGLAPVLDDAFEVALAADVTLYDALYVATAEQLGVRMITADRRLIAKLAGTRWAGIAEPLSG